MIGPDRQSAAGASSHFCGWSRPVTLMKLDLFPLGPSHLLLLEVVTRQTKFNLEVQTCNYTLIQWVMNYQMIPYSLIHQHTVPRLETEQPDCC